MASAFPDQTPRVRLGFGAPPESGATPIPGSWLASALLAGVVAEAVLMRQAGLRIDAFARNDLPFYLAGMVAVGLCGALRRRATRWQQVVRDTAEYFGVFTTIALVGAVASYPVSATTDGFVDAALQRADVAMGFDWLAWYRTVAAHPALQVAGRFAYDSIYWSACATMIGFAVTGRQDRARAFLAALLIAAALTLVLFHFMPAVGPFAYLWRGVPPYMPESELWQPLLIPELRRHAVGLVDLAALRGLVSAPSFHAAAAVIFAAGAWPMPRLRWPMAALNAAMLVATPVEGTHYLSDIVLGIGVAALSLWLAQRLAGTARDRIAAGPVRVPAAA